ncbi:PDR/VanB family oxidoreductase [Gordonia sp. NB41Y]|uniref:PDR/VanB family oxidoreductase n=1 Tax=Gordonia sp. NB41Y TaxID=875808 RepID=UPI00034A940A|nr:PDR/VanB family oxidoreductase [Gordonia sp. NB41Y]EMP15128.2 ferredoxin [Gordonia sp. NB41Y]WLP90700.1 PDR/VanB family oxidoreductase [Gordonia sp. NB41Y]
MNDPNTEGNLLSVRRKEWVSPTVVALTLGHPDGRRLADWAPGAHIDVMLPNGLGRQYSLCGDRWDATTYRIAVRREADGRGGSAYIHDHLRVGDRLPIGGPRNNFPMVPADRYLFIAGGIGITPIIPMITQAEMLGADWNLLYLGRHRETMPFLEELSGHGERVTVVTSDQGGRADIGACVSAVDDRTRVYACGPQGLLDDLARYAGRWPAGRLRMERFSATDALRPARTEPFDVELARSKRVVSIAPDESILDALGAQGVSVLTSCREGVCGTCEITVLDGEPDHRDSILDDHERAAGDCMFVCVSRSLSDRLVLDL